jgi:hypothetical protein
MTPLSNIVEMIFKEIPATVVIHLVPDNDTTDNNFSSIEEIKSSLLHRHLHA